MAVLGATATLAEVIVTVDAGLRPSEDVNGRFAPGSVNRLRRMKVNARLRRAAS